MSDIQKQLASVKKRISEAAQACGRKPDEITLLAVSKTRSATTIAEAVAESQQHFGENYLQEALDKIAILQNPTLIWHFIGPIQSNKTRAIAQHFHWVHTIDRLKIAERLSNHRGANSSSDSPPLNVCIQVNIDNEQSKSGVGSDEVLSLALTISNLPHLRLRGLMAIPQALADGANHEAFERMNQLFHAIKARGDFSHWDTLSMGMSADLECAIQHGATIVRVGTDIFGQRDYSTQFE